MYFPRYMFRFLFALVIHPIVKLQCFCFFAVGGMNRPSKAVTQAKKVAPPAVPDVFRHSGSSFGSAGYASSEDSCFLPGSGPGGTTDEGSYGVPSGKSPGPIFTHPGFAFPPVVGKYAHAEDQGAILIELLAYEIR